MQYVFARVIFRQSIPLLVKICRWWQNKSVITNTNLFPQRAVKISSWHYETRFRKEPLLACRAVHYLQTFPTTVRFLARARFPRARLSRDNMHSSRSRSRSSTPVLIWPIRPPFFCSQFSLCLPGDDPLKLRMKARKRERSFHLNLNVANYVRVETGARRDRAWNHVLNHTRFRANNTIYDCLAS